MKSDQIYQKITKISHKNPKPTKQTVDIPNPQKKEKHEFALELYRK